MKAPGIRQHSIGRTRDGFTLIELLVVIAIIAILAAILFPVFAQAREKARQITCVSNGKQIGTAIMMYIQDYDEFYPRSQWYDSYSPRGKQHLWAGDILPYIKNGRADGFGGVFKCPSFPGEQNNNLGVNERVMEDCWDPCKTSGVNLAAVDRPADLSVVMDKGRSPFTWSWHQFLADGWAWAQGHANAWAADGKPNQNAQGFKYSAVADTDLAQDGKDPGWPNPAVMPRFRHQGTTTVIFGDGHAKSMMRGRLNWRDHIYQPGMGNAPGRETW